MAHLIIAAIYDGLLSFEYSLAREILGRDRRELTPDWYDFQLCRVEPGRLLTSHGFEIHVEAGLETLATADTILIAGWRDPSERPAEPFLEALRLAHARGARLVTVCTGSFVPAYAGLLDGRAATTHWLHAELFRQLFPRVRLRENALYLHDLEGPAAISSSAGCAAGLDLALAVVREDFGQGIANTVARRMVAPAHRDGGQSQYAESPVGVTTEEAFGPMLDWMLENLDTPLSMEAVAKRFGLSLRTFQRRFKEVTRQTPHRWLVLQRVARAREWLESSDKSIEEIAGRSGLGSAANLRKHLARHLGTTPRAYRTAFRDEPGP